MCAKLGNFLMCVRLWLSSGGQAATLAEQGCGRIDNPLEMADTYPLAIRKFLRSIHSTVDII